MPHPPSPFPSIYDASSRIQDLFPLKGVHDNCHLLTGLDGRRERSKLDGTNHIHDEENFAAETDGHAAIANGTGRSRDVSNTDVGVGGATSAYRGNVEVVLGAAIVGRRKTTKRSGTAKKAARTPNSARGRLDETVAVTFIHGVALV